MKRGQYLAYILVIMLMFIPIALGQSGSDVIEPIDPDMVNPSANISFPPPVYVVRDSVDIHGTVTMDGMRNFFIEFRPLDLGEMMDTEDGDEENQWFPATLPRIEAIADDVLGTWNTVTLRDALYELRLTINTGDEPEYFRVSPIRVENNPPEFVAEMIEEAVPPTPIPEPTATPDTRPRVIANVDSNVRAGDSTRYPVVGSLLTGVSAKIRGISAYNSGWYYIELANGRSGFIFPGIVDTEGDLSNLPRINPPPLPPTPIPLPTAVPVQQQPAQQPAAATGANLVMENINISPWPPKCNETVNITLTVRNNGTGASNNGSIRVVDKLNSTGADGSSTSIGFSQLPAKGGHNVFGNLTVSTNFEEDHHITLYLDNGNAIPETNENDNVWASGTYNLAKANC